MGDARTPAYRQFPDDWNGGCITCGASVTGRIPRVLSIAGTDPSGGAGLQADLKTFSAHGAYGMGVVTALVSQNTMGVRDVHVPPTDFLRSQLDAVSDDVTIDAIKIGMLFDAPIIAEVADWLDTLPKRSSQSDDESPGGSAHGTTSPEGTPAPIVVLDPVMVATSGDRLLKADAEKALHDLLRHVDLVTPNIPEPPPPPPAKPSTKPTPSPPPTTPSSWPRAATSPTTPSSTPSSAPTAPPNASPDPASTPATPTAPAAPSPRPSPPCGPAPATPCSPSTPQNPG